MFLRYIYKKDVKMKKIRLKVMVDDSGPIVELDK